MQTSTPFRSTPSIRATAHRDIIVVAVVTLACAALSARFDGSEFLFSLTRRFEYLQLDEWPVVFLVLAIGMIWLSWRRYRHAQQELDARRKAECELERALAENRRVSQHHLLMQESERKHLARELHDEMGQYLNAIKLDAVAIDAEETKSRAFYHDASKRIVAAVDHVQASVRAMMSRLRPVGLDELGLLDALEHCVDRWRERFTSTHISLIVDRALPKIGEVLDLTVYRLIQEGLTNCFKHARATKIEIELRRETERELLVSIRDDGVGATSQINGIGFGLRGMRERVEMLNGLFTAAGQPGAGFIVEARLPLGERDS